MNLINQPVKSESKIGERGIALLFALLALMMLSTIAIALTFSAATESSINNNYRQEETAYFAARAGVEDLRDRIAIVPGLAGQLPVPPDLPGTATGYVLYLINQGTDPTTVQPWKANSAYMDDELCHDGYSIQNWPSAVPGPGVRCVDAPNGNNWYQTATSTIQWNGTSAAVPYKWARLAMKQNNSVMFGDPAAGGTQNYYYVDPTKAASQPVCYDGTSERVPPAGTTSCAAWANLATPVYANSVYIITAMAVTSSGARKVVQQELATVPSPPFPYGLFATNNGCNAITFSGNGYTDSYNGANGPYGGANQFNSGGDIATFGNVSLGGNANIQGIVGVTGTTYTTTVGPCGALQNNGVTGSGSNWKNQGITPLPVGIAPNSFQTPPAPSPAPPTTTTTISKSGTLPPGTYGNISLQSGTLTLSPGVYNINSISASGGTSIAVSPAGQVVLNIAGAGGQAFDFSGQGITNTSGIPYDFLVNYAGTDTIKIGGKSSQYLVMNAPNAAVNVTGQGDVFGSLIANTISYTGNGNWHLDTSSLLKPIPNQNFVSLSFHEISY